ncbi:MAG: iron-containing alcohol dehydrogenase, partial [Myxococcota bacterium]
MTVVWSFPTRVVFGEGAVTGLSEEVKRLGGSRVFLVSDKGVHDAGLLEPIEELLKEAAIDFATFTEISSNPLEKELLAAANTYHQAKSDIIVAVGGGSPLDVAKLIRVATTHPLPIAQYDDAIGGDAKITEPMPPMIAIPTTAGTGSEVGRAGVVTIEESNKKTVIFSPRLMPEVALLDPALTATMPSKITAATGFDALTHCIEAYCAQGDHPMADAIAISGIRLVVRHLERVIRDGKDIRSRGEMMKAAMMGAVAFQKGLGACHSLAHPLSAEHDLHHGLANALCLPAVLDFNRSAVPERIAHIAKELGVRGEDNETLCFECAGAVRALRRKVGLPEGLGAAGVDEDAPEKLAPLAFADACHQLNPRTCTEEDMLSLYRSHRGAVE